MTFQVFIGKAVKRKPERQQHIINKGDTFGEFTVLDDVSLKYNYVTKAGTINEQWVRKCICSCGNIAYVSPRQLTLGKSKSCGHIRDMSDEAMINIIIHGLKKSAATRNFCWELSNEEASWFLSQPCFYCKTVGANTLTLNTVSKDKYSYNGIDRLDRRQGYTILNCVPCCGDCNKAKHKDSLDEFLIRIKTIYENLNLAHFIPVKEQI